MYRLYMRSARQAALQQAGLSRDGFANLNQQFLQRQRLVQNNNPGIWRQNADLRDEVHRNSRGVRHTRPAQVPARGHSAGSEARLGDILVTAMRRIESLEAAVSRLTTSLETQARDCQMAVESVQQKRRGAICRVFNPVASAYHVPIVPCLWIIAKVQHFSFVKREQWSAWGAAYVDSNVDCALAVVSPN